MSTKYEEKSIFTNKSLEGSRQVLQVAVLITAIITGFSSDLGRETMIFYISRPHSTGWNINVQNDRLRLPNGLKLEQEPGKYRNFIHQGQQQESTTSHKALYTPAIQNKWLALLPKVSRPLVYSRHESTVPQHCRRKTAIWGQTNQITNCKELCPTTSKAPVGGNGQSPSVQQGRGLASKNKNWPSKYNLKGQLMNHLY